MKHLRVLAVSFSLVACVGLSGVGPVWAQRSTSHECLSQPISIAYIPPDAGDKAKSAGKGILSSVLSSASGGAVRTRGDEGPELTRRPRLPKSRLEIEESDLKLEVQGALEDGAIVMAIRVRKDPDEGGPHLIALQDIHCRVLLPGQVDVFELWDRGSLSVSWSSSTYSDGRLVDRDSGAFDTGWGDLKARYPDTADIPGIWQSYGEPPLEGLRGVTATFELPPGETFDPSEWFLVAHITAPSPEDNTVTTKPVVSEIEPRDKDRYGFTRAQNVNWQPQEPTGVSATVRVTSDAGLVCEDDCRKILEEINQLECATEDCSEEKAALDAALAALADAQQGWQKAEDLVDEAEADVADAQQALDDALAEKDEADRKLAVQSETQARLQRALAQGGYGLSPAQTQHGIESSRDVVRRLEDDAAEAQAAVDAARAALNAANAALQAANQAAAAATAAVESAQQEVDDARRALSDCMQRESERCQAIDVLWQQYQDCRRRCRDQSEARSDVDRVGRHIEEGQDDMADAANDFDRARQAMNDANAGVRELGGEASSHAQELAREAAEARREAEQRARDAQQALREAEGEYARGDLDGAREAAREARRLQNLAEGGMDDAADRMRDAAGEARRRYQNELDEEYLRQQREWAEQRRAAGLKKQACMSLLAENFADDGDSSFLEDLGGFVSGEAQRAIEQAGEVPLSPEEYQDFVEKVEAARHRLDQLLTLLNGIGDNASIESRNEAFRTALDIAGEIAERIPGLAAFFNFYSSAFNAAVQALYALQEEMIGRFKPMVDDFARTSNCCSYSHEQLQGTSLEDIVNDKWDQFRRINSAPLARLSGDSLRKLEAYFKSRLTLRWASCCIQFVLDG